jgi:hypothetical protein
MNTIHDMMNTLSNTPRNTNPIQDEKLQKYIDKATNTTYQPGEGWFGGELQINHKDGSILLKHTPSWVCYQTGSIYSNDQVLNLLYHSMKSRI